MNDELQSILLGTAGLGLAAGVALVLTLVRDGVDADPARLGATVRSGLAAIVLQGAHSAEEFGAGFHERFPALLGLAAWPPVFFVSFNLFWLAVWLLSLRGLTERRRSALFPLWFLGLGCVANGLAHPLFAAATGGYFPGLVSAPFVGVAGVVLVRHLLGVTEGRGGPVAAA